MGIGENFYAVYFGYYEDGADSELYQCTIEAFTKKDAVRKALENFDRYAAVSDLEHEFDFIKVIES